MIFAGKSFLIRRSKETLRCLLLLEPENLMFNWLWMGIDDQIMKYLLMAYFSGTLYRNI